MKENRVLLITKILYILFFIATIIILFMVYKQVNTRAALLFGVGYVFFVFFMLLYVPIITIINSRKLEKGIVRKKLLKAIALFISLTIFNLAFDYVVRDSEVNLTKACIHALGLALGISFLDVTFLKKNKG